MTAGGARAGAGRPRGRTPTTRLPTIDVTAQLAALVRAYAAEHECSISECVRRALWAYLAVAADRSVRDRG